MTWANSTVWNLILTFLRCNFGIGIKYAGFWPQPLLCMSSKRRSGGQPSAWLQNPPASAQFSFVDEEQLEISNGT